MRARRSVWHKKTIEPDRVAVAETVLRIAVLLRAGIHPAASWGYLAALGDPVAQRVHGATDVAVALSSEGVHAQPLAAAWKVASTVGAPLAESLRSIALALRDANECADEVKVALAEPAGTAKLMAWLPLVAVGLGIALGFDVVGVFLTPPFGPVCLLGGVLLMVAARRWSGALVNAAQPAGGIPGLDAELLAVALSGGVSLVRARAVTVAATEIVVSERTESTLSLSRSAGVPAVELLRAAATIERHRARIEGRVRAARLSGQLLLPLGICILPAFLLLGVAPMFLSIVMSGSFSL